MRSELDLGRDRSRHLSRLIGLISTNYRLGPFPGMCHRITVQSGLEVQKHASEGINSGYETQGRHHQKSKTGVSVSSKFFLKSVKTRVLILDIELPQNINIKIQKYLCERIYAYLSPLNAKKIQWLTPVEIPLGCPLSTLDHKKQLLI